MVFAHVMCSLQPVKYRSEGVRRLTAVPDVSDSLGSDAILSSKLYSARFLALSFDSQRVNFGSLISL